MHASLFCVSESMIIMLSLLCVVVWYSIVYVVCKEDIQFFVISLLIESIPSVMKESSLSQYVFVTNSEFLCVWFSVRDWALEPQITSEHQAKPIFLSEDKNASMFFLYVNFEWNSFFFRWKIVRSLACEAFLYGQTFTFFAFQYSVQFSGVNVKLTRFWSSCGISFGPEIWNRKIGNVFPNLDSSPPESKAIFSGESKYQLISCFSSFRRVC